MTTNRHQITNNPAQVIIYYDGNTSHLLELKDAIEQILSPLLPTQVKRVQGGASPAFPVLEIIFAFSVTTIMTSVLSKFGEDIYKHIKDKIIQKSTENEEDPMLIIKVFTDKVAVNGYVRLNDNKALIDAINTIPQMINNAQNTEIKQPTEYKPTSIQHGNDFISITKSGFLFQYEFDVKNTKWTLQNIGKMKNP